MNKKQNVSIRSRIANSLMSVFVLALVISPMYLTGKWITGVLFGNDPRKVAQVEPLQPRAYDLEHAEIKPFDQPIVTVTFDDGWESAYVNAFPLLQRNGIRTTQYVISDVFNNPTYMSRAQVHAMQKAGHEIGSHTMTHPDLVTLSDDDLERELSDSKAKLSKDFGPIRDFAAPLGSTDERVEAAIKRHYRSERNVAADPITVDDKDVNVMASFNPYNIIAYTVRDTTTPADIARLLDYTVKNNGWLVLTYHQVGVSVEMDGEAYGVTPDSLENQLVAISKAPVRTATMGDVLTALSKSAKGQWW